MAAKALVPENPTIGAAALLAARPASQWVTLGPFFAAEFVLAYMAFDPSAIWGDDFYSENQRALDFAHVAIVPIVCIAQLFACFMTVWSIGFKMRVMYKPAADLASASHVYVKTKPHRGESAIVPLTQHAATGETLFVFQQSKWRWRPAEGQFHKPDYPVGLPFTRYQSLIDAGPNDTPAEAARVRELYGNNLVDIFVPDFKELLIDHMQAPFFVFQMFCVTLWLLDDYWMVALFNGFMMFTLECTVVMQRQKSMKTMRDMGAVPTTQVRVRRAAGDFIDRPSTELLPNDVIVLGNEGPAPADVVLIDGTVAANEAMLTGESTPQMKTALPQDAAADTTLLNMEEHARYVIYSGTTLLSSNGSGASSHSGALGVVVKTGFETKQGELIRTILHSQSRVSQNSGEALSFIGLLLVFACMASWYVLQRGLADPTKSRWKLFLTCTQIITNVVPPELPMELALAVNTSLMALMKLRVFCTEPFRIPFAGKLDTCCFDKTGTLTTDEMLFAGVEFGGTATPELKRNEAITGNAELVLVSCHALVMLPGDKKPAGDAMEMAAVEALKWEVRPDDLMVKQAAAGGKAGSSQRRVDIVKRFPFDSTRRRMSCIVRTSAGDTFIVAKGSSESIGKCLASMPPHYAELNTHYARKGLRVIALATRAISSVDAADMKRDDAEANLKFAGYAVFECPLKSDAAATVKMLTHGSHRCAMITGDSIATAVAVARDVGMCSYPTGYVATEAGSANISWVPYDTDEADEAGTKRTGGAAAVATPPADSDVFVNAEALTAEGFTAVVKTVASRTAVWARCAPHQKEDIIAQLKHNGATVLMAGDGTNDVGGLKQAHVGIAVLNSALVLAANDANKNEDGTGPKVLANGLPAEMTNKLPEPLKENAGFMEQLRYQMAVAKHQAELQARKKYEANQTVQKQQQAAAIAKAKTAAGVSDNGASNTETGVMSLFNELDDTSGMPMVKLGDASIAAPFTCKSKKMTSICDIVRLGRCTLVTTLQMYKILALNCLISAYTMAVLFTDGVKFGQTQMVMSGIMIAVCFLFLSRSKPLDELSKERPITRVFHPYMLVSIGGQFAVHLYSMIQSVRLVQAEDPDAMAAQRGEDDEDFRPTLLNSVLFLMTTMMTVTTFAVNYKGHPFMTSMRENKPMAVCLGLLALTVLCGAMELDADFNEQFELVKFPTDDMRQAFLGLLAVDVLGTFAVEFVSHRLLSKLP